MMEIQSLVRYDFTAPEHRRKRGKQLNQFWAWKSDLEGIKSLRPGLRIAATHRLVGRPEDKTKITRIFDESTSSDSELEFLCVPLCFWPEFPNFFGNQLALISHAGSPFHGCWSRPEIQSTRSRFSRPTTSHARANMFDIASSTKNSMIGPRQ
jgi:hypothetical protein